MQEIDLEKYYNKRVKDEYMEILPWTSLLVIICLIGYYLWTRF